MIVVDLGPAGEQTIGVNEEGEEIKRRQSENCKIEQTEGAEWGILCFIGLECRSGGKRNQFQKEQAISDGTIGHGNAEPKLIGAPDQLADQPHQHTEKHQKPEEAKLRVCAQGVPEGESSCGDLQDGLQVVSDEGEGIALGKSESRQQGDACRTKCEEKTKP